LVTVVGHTLAPPIVNIGPLSGQMAGYKNDLSLTGSNYVIRGPEQSNDKQEGLNYELMYLIMT